MSFLDHLEELRWHIIRSLISIVVFAIAAFLAKDLVFGTIIMGPSRADFWTYNMICRIGEMINSTALCIDELPFIIQSRKMTGQFTMHITSSFVIGIILAFPYAFWEFWRFIAPGLLPNERNLTRGATFFVSLLFLTGILFGYYVVAPISVNFLANYQVDPSVKNEFDIISYVSTVSMIVLACGIMFQLPIVIFFLSKAEIVNPQILKTYRKHAIVVILVLSAIITPPDVISQMLICLPLLLLYEASIILSRIVLRNKRKQELAERD